MKKYFYLQLKRVAKIFPFVLTVTIALLIGLAVVLYGLLAMFDDRADNQRFTIAVAGDTDNQYLSWGISAMQTFDETRFSIEFVEMAESEAQSALEKGEISAYVIIPDGFVEKAVSGEVDPVTYVTSAGMEGITALFKKEITSLVTDMVIYSQKGSYGVGMALDNNGFEEISNSHINQISLEYADLIFQRNQLYSVSELGISDGISTPQYYVCAILVMLLVLIGMPFAAIYVKKDYAFNRLLLSRGYSSVLQLGCEYGAHLIAMLLQSAVILLIVAAALGALPDSASKNMLTQSLGDIVVKVIPVVVMLSAFNIMMFEFSNNLVSGLLLHFFAAISLCYVSGCMYPIYAFPKVIKNIAAFLPSGIARGYLATCFSLESSVSGFVGLIFYAAVFFGIALLVRFRKTVGIRR